MLQGSDAPRLERPIFLDAHPTAPILRYLFRTMTLHLHTLMPPIVLEWLAQLFGQAAQDALWVDCLRRLTPAGRDAVGGHVLEPLDVLQLCVLATAPFRACPDRHVRDVYPPHGDPKPLACRHWTRLLATLAEALFAYLTAPHAWVLAGAR